MDLGRKLLSFRHDRNYSQNKVAELLEVSQSTYCGRESNTISPKAENLVKIAALYEIDIKELLPSISFSITQNAKTLGNGPGSRIEISDALMKVAESIDSLVQLLKYIMQENKKEK